MISIEQLGQHKFRLFARGREKPGCTIHRDNVGGSKSEREDFIKHFRYPKSRIGVCRLQKKKRKAPRLHAATYLACEKYVLDQRGRIDGAFRAERIKRKREGGTERERERD